jgi:hypothetical protein
MSELGAHVPIGLVTERAVRAGMVRKVVYLYVPLFQDQSVPASWTAEQITFDSRRGFDGFSFRVTSD